MLSAYVKLIRPLNALMAVIGTYLGFAIATHAWGFSIPLFLALLAVFCIISAGQAINDYFDFEVDKKTGKEKPLVQGHISKTQALQFSLGLFLLGVLIAYQINSLAFFIASFFAVMLFLYSAVLSKIKFFGNIIVALGTGFTFIFGASVAQITPLVLMIALIGFLSNWVREIIKDVEDKHADKGHKLTLPLLFTSAQTNVTILLLLGLTLISVYLPFAFGQGNLFYGVLATGANILFILAGREVIQGHAAKGSGNMKKGMLLGLIAQAFLV